MDLVAAFGQFGPLGLMIGYLIWRENAGRNDRLAYDRERLETDKALAAALATLTTLIRGDRHV